MTAHRTKKPLLVTVERRDLMIRVGWQRPNLNATARLHYGWERMSELPGLSLGLCLGRFETHAGIGSGWMGEDGDSRTLLHLTASLSTWKLRYVGCWFGHKPQRPYPTARYIYCARCDETLEEDAPPKVAAA